jgi:predicted dinucleotide-binding enzyme
MKIGILGSGGVGRALAGKLFGLGHEVWMGTRDVAALMGRSAPATGRGEPFAAWHGRNPNVKVATFAEAAAHAEIVINATAGSGSLAALRLAGEKNLEGKVLIDIANPLDFSRGMPPSLLVCNTDSLGEQIQRAFPAARVVKTLNTMNALLMVEPRQVAGGDHTVFVSGNDAGAKKQVTDILTNWLGWKQVVDLGDITTARGTEMILPLWVCLMGVVGGPMFNFKIAQ